MTYVADGITYNPGSGLKSIFRPGLLGKGITDDIPYDFIKLSLEKIDKALARNHEEYAGSGGEGRDISKFSDIEHNIDSMKTEFMPFLMCRYGEANELVVENGRHRIAYLHERNYKSIWCVIPAEQKSIFQSHYSQ